MAPKTGAPWWTRCTIPFPGGGGNQLRRQHTAKAKGLYRCNYSPYLGNQKEVIPSEPDLVT